MQALGSDIQHMRGMPPMLVIVKSISYEVSPSPTWIVPYFPTLSCCNIFEVFNWSADSAQLFVADLVVWKIKCTKTRGVRIFKILNIFGQCSLFDLIHTELLLFEVTHIYGEKKYTVSCNKWPIPAHSMLHCITPVYCGETLVHTGGVNTHVM